MFGITQGFGGPVSGILTEGYKSNTSIPTGSIITQGLGGPFLINQGYGSLSTSPMISGSTYAQIMLAMVDQIVSKGVLPSNAVGLSLTKMPSSNVLANAYITITPGREQASQDQAYGLGRYGSGMYSTAYVNIYCRTARDRAYQDTYFVTGASGIRSLVYSVTDALQLFLPVDDDGDALTEEPIRMLGNERIVKYGKSNEWGYVSLMYQIRYAKQCNTDLLL